MDGFHCSKWLELDVQWCGLLLWCGGWAGFIRDAAASCGSAQVTTSFKAPVLISYSQEERQNEKPTPFAGKLGHKPTTPVQPMLLLKTEQGYKKKNLALRTTSRVPWSLLSVDFPQSEIHTEPQEKESMCSCFIQPLGSGSESRMKDLQAGKQESWNINTFLISVAVSSEVSTSALFCDIKLKISCSFVFLATHFTLSCWYQWTNSPFSRMKGHKLLGAKGPRGSGSPDPCSHQQKASTEAQYRDS